MIVAYEIHVYKNYILDNEILVKCNMSRAVSLDQMFTFWLVHEL